MSSFPVASSSLYYYYCSSAICRETNPRGKEGEWGGEARLGTKDSLDKEVGMIRRFYSIKIPYLTKMGPKFSITMSLRR